jgi:hypothetical protein
MTTPVQDQDFSYAPFCRDIKTATKEQIMKLFEIYDFRDPLDHKLTMYRAFHELLDRINFAQHLLYQVGIT